MTFYRHFIERNNFETFVATNSHHVDEYDLPYQPALFQAPFWWRRLQNTRLHRWIVGFQSLHGAWMFPADVLNAAKAFKPDLVFTMAGSWNWTALAAQKAARALDVPLVASFNDWYDYPSFGGLPSQKARVEARFRKFYREADLALCTSEGMREALGPHPNAHVWYPIGARMPSGAVPYFPRVPRADKPFVVFFGGSLGEWYGGMLEQLVTLCWDKFPNIHFRIFGGLQSWSSTFEDLAREKGVFGGRVDFDRLRAEAESADLLLLPMGFDPAGAQVEKTSFKTKFLDYLTFKRPILVWGPEYCSAVRTARAYDSAECISEPTPLSCANAIEGLAKDLNRRAVLVENAMKMYQDVFHPDKIHGVLVREIRNLLE